MKEIFESSTNDGKWTVKQFEDGSTRLVRYGEGNFSVDNALLQFAQELKSSNEVVKAARAVVAASRRKDQSIPIGATDEFKSLASAVLKLADP